MDPPLIISPLNSAAMNASGSVAQNRSTSFTPGFQPSLAAHSTRTSSSARVMLRMWSWSVGMYGLCCQNIVKLFCACPVLYVNANAVTRDRKSILQRLSIPPRTKFALALGRVLLSRNERSISNYFLAVCPCIDLGICLQPSVWC